MIPEFQHFQDFSVIVIIWLVSAALADTLIAVLLVIHLVSPNVLVPFHLNADKRYISNNGELALELQTPLSIESFDVFVFSTEC